MLKSGRIKRPQVMHLSMNILIIKTSSMGDVIHTLPAITDIKLQFPKARIDWLVDEAFQDIPKLHPAINSVLTLPLRKYKGKMHTLTAIKTLKMHINTFRKTHYTHIIDAQGLLKSALVLKSLRGQHKHGFDKHSAKEPFATWAYPIKHRIEKELHAIHRVRLLCANALKYSIKPNLFEFGLSSDIKPKPNAPILCFHGTSLANKQWPEHYWKTLLKSFRSFNRPVHLAWGSHDEHERSKRLAQDFDYVEVLPKKSIHEMFLALQNCALVIGVDTGFSHLANALSIPLIILYGPFDAGLVGPIKQPFSILSSNFPCAPCKQKHCTYEGPQLVKPACFSTIPPEKVLSEVHKFL